MHVELVGQMDAPAIQRHRRVEHLEGGAHLVDAQRGTVEARIRRRRRHIVRVEIGHRHHGEDLAGAGIEHEADPADAGEVGNAAGQFLAHNLLDADVERELDGMAPAGQHVVEGILDAGNALVVQIGEADDMAHQ